MPMTLNVSGQKIERLKHSPFNSMISTFFNLIQRQFSETFP